jgi:hypothetical protein
MTFGEPQLDLIQPGGVGGSEEKAPEWEAYD